LLSSLLRLRFYRLHHAVNVTFQNDAVIDHGGDFINYLRGCDRGVSGQRNTQYQHSPVLHTFSIFLSALRVCLSNITTSESALVRQNALT